MDKLLIILAIFLAGISGALLAGSFVSKDRQKEFAQVDEWVNTLEKSVDKVTILNEERLAQLEKEVRKNSAKNRNFAERVEYLEEYIYPSIIIRAWVMWVVLFILVVTALLYTGYNWWRGSRKQKKQSPQRS